LGFACFTFSGGERDATSRNSPITANTRTGGHISGPNLYGAFDKMADWLPVAKLI
jgi:hypothetical protein